LNQVSAVHASDLACLRGGRMVFRSLSFEVAAGKALAIEGPNGAGKSSLLRLLAGFLAPVSGRVRLSTGEGEVDDAETRGRYVGFLGHQDAAKTQLTVMEQLRFHVQLYEVDDDAAAALETVGLSRVAELPCQYLSAGQKKRLSLARLQLTKRPLWLVDEPLASLDVAGKTLAASLFAQHCASGGIVIAATHEPLGFDAARLSLNAA
jgi:heme exporter protein A